MNTIQRFACIAGAAGCAVVALQPAANQPVTDQRRMEGAAPLAEVDRLVAVIQPTKGHSVRGVVYFTKVEGGVRVEAQIGGLKPGSAHGFHIHQYGDATAPDASSAGEHFNPGGHPHALPSEQPRHAGDLGNLRANDSGIATRELVVDIISLTGKEDSILGRAVVIHGQPDNGAQPSGHAGARIGIGVIGIAQPDTELAGDGRERPRP